MKNFKSQLIAVTALLSLVGSPAVGLAAIEVTSGADARGEVKKELEDLKAARDAFKESRKEESEKRVMEVKEKRTEVKKDLEVKRKEAEMKKGEHRKTVLLRLIDVQIKHFEGVAERVAKMPNIDDALKAQLKTEIDKAIAALNDLKAKVQNAKTAEELKSLTQQIRDNLKTKRDIVKKIVEAIAKSHLNSIVSKAEERIKTAEAKIADLKTAGKDVTELEKLLATAKDKLAAAKANLAKDSLEEAKDALKDLYKALGELADKSEKEEK